MCSHRHLHSLTLTAQCMCNVLILAGWSVEAVCGWSSPPGVLGALASTGLPPGVLLTPMINVTSVERKVTMPTTVTATAAGAAGAGNHDNHHTCDITSHWPEGNTAAEPHWHGVDWRLREKHKWWSHDTCSTDSDTHTHTPSLNTSSDLQAHDPSRWSDWQMIHHTAFKFSDTKENFSTLFSHCQFPCVHCFSMSS